MVFTRKKLVYTDVLADSWSTLKNNPIIFFPVAYALLAIIVFALFAIVFSWIAGSNSFLSTLFIIITLLGVLLVFVHVSATQIFIFSRLALGKKVHCKEALYSAKSFMSRIVILFLLILLALIPALVVLAFFSFPLIFVLNNLETANVTLGLVSLILTIIAALFFLVLYKSWTLFAFPKLMFEKKKAGRILSESWSLLWKLDMRNVLSTFFITFGIGLGVNLVFSALEKIVSEFLLNPKIIILLVQILSILTSIVIGLWLFLFVYKVFVTRYGVKG